MPASSPSAIARVIAEAGRSLQSGRGLSPRHPFHVLSADERERLQREVRSILDCSVKWPKHRQMFSVITS